jgi:hypothetical protein
MNVKINRKDASGWVGASVTVIEEGNEYKGEEGVVTNALPAADGSVWSLHVRLVKFPKMALPLVLSPSDVERNGLN